MTREALRADDVRKVYRSRTGPPVEALRGVSLAFYRGERIALLGRNGAGKTTFLRIASSLLVPTSGRIEIPNGLCCSFEDPSGNRFAIFENVRPNVFA